MGFSLKKVQEAALSLVFKRDITHSFSEKENAGVFIQILQYICPYRMRLMTQLRSDLTNCFLCLHLSVWSLWYSLGSLWFNINLEFRGHHTLNIFLLRAYYSLMNVTRLNIGNKVFPLLPQMVGTGELNLKCHF